MSKLGDALRAPFLKRFGGAGARDRMHLRAWLEEVGDFTPTYARILEAFKAGNVNGARAEVDQLIASVSGAQERMPTFDSADLQTVTKDYNAALLALARSADGVLRLDEEATHDGTVVDRSYADEALAEFRRRGIEARAASQELLTRLTADLSAGQRQQVDEFVRKQADGEGDRSG